MSEFLLFRFECLLMLHSEAMDGSGIGERHLALAAWPEPTSTEVFSGGGRVRVVPMEQVAEAVREIRESGLLPLILCLSPSVRKTLEEQLRRLSPRVVCFVRGYDDDRIDWLLRHPSRETLIALASGGRLIYPNAEYRQALTEWMRTDAQAREIVRRLQTPEVRLEDFQLIDETNEATWYGCTLRWNLNPKRRLALKIEPLEEKVRLWHTLDDHAADSPLLFDNGFINFNEEGEGKPSFEQLLTLAERFQLDRFVIDTLNPDRPGITGPWERFRAWLSKLDNSWSESWPADQWAIFARGWLADEPWSRLKLVDASRARPVAGNARGAVDSPPTDIAPMPSQRGEHPIEKPILVQMNTASQRRFDVIWRQSRGGRVVRPRNAPQVTVHASARSPSWEAQWSADLSELTLAGVDLPENPRYQVRWDCDHNRLDICFADESSST